MKGNGDAHYSRRAYFLPLGRTHNRSARTRSDIEIGAELTSISFYATHGLVQNPISGYVIEKVLRM